MTRISLIRSIFPLAVAAFALAVSSPAYSSVITLTAGGASCSAEVFPPSQPGVESDFQTKCDTSPASLLYKANFGGSDDGPFAASYDTIFGNFQEMNEVLASPSDALIQYIMAPAIQFANVWVLAKGGASDPTYYGWNISGWNGTDAIAIAGLWEGTQGAISNVSIWGHTPVSVPEPRTLALLGLGLLAIAMMRRRRAT